MMQVIIETPTKAYIEGASDLEIESLRKTLTYRNTANEHEMKRHYNNQWLRNKNRAAWEIKLAEMKANIVKVLLMEENGRYYIRPGSIPYLGLPESSIINKVQYPTPKPVPWAKQLPFELHPYQQQSVDKLINIKHGNVELCTGAGKSAILIKLCRETGFRAAIIAPSQSIFNELLEKFEHHLGRNNVGALGDGKRRLGKRFTICIADSLTNLKAGTEEYEFFAGLDMICADESHTWGAETLETICHEIFAKVPYRMFLSGTQTRGDGAEKLLEAIIGQKVHTLTTSEAIKGGYISNHEFMIIDVESSDPNRMSPDTLEMKRIHLLRNRNVAAVIAKLANANAVNGKQTLVLVEELGQIAMLLPMLNVPVAYAHSESSKAKLEPLGLEKVDRAESVERFNKNEVKVLIGTSCIATGTNIYPTHVTANWVGGSSEIKTKQGAVGRSVRLSNQNPWADKCVMKEKSIIVDFNIHDIYVLTRHLEDRVGYYKDSGTEIRYIKLKKG